MFITKRKLRKIIYQQMDMLRFFQSKAEFESTIRTCNYTLQVLTNVLTNADAIKPIDYNKLNNFRERYTEEQLKRIKHLDVEE